MKYESPEYILGAVLALSICIAWCWGQSNHGATYKAQQIAEQQRGRAGP